jgi:uncharacterized protein (TIGR03086 family)
MTIPADVVYVNGLEFFGDVITQVPKDGWAEPSPCQGWSARDVLGHVFTTTELGVGILRGEAVKPPTMDSPGDAAPDDPYTAWPEVAANAREAVEHADLTAVIDSPIGKRSVADGLAFPAIDLYVHGWDLARSAGVRVEIPDDVIAFAQQALAPIAEEKMRSAAVFRNAVPVRPEASASDRFLAWTGRDPG